MTPGAMNNNWMSCQNHGRTVINARSIVFNALVVALIASATASSSGPLPPPPGSPLSSMASAADVLPAAAVADGQDAVVASDSTSSPNFDSSGGSANGVDDDPLIISDAASALAANLASPVDKPVMGGNNENMNWPPIAAGNGAVPKNKQTDQNSSSGWFGKILGGNKNNNLNQNSGQKGAPEGILPPPPPPPPPMTTERTVTTAQPGYDSSPPWGYQQQQNYDPNHNPSYNYFDPNAQYQNLLMELDESTLREMTLTHQLQNLTSLVTTLTSESESLVLRIDVMTERLADSESNFHYVHNRNLELDANCTSLAKLVTELRDEISAYESRATQLQDEKDEDEKAIQELRAELRKVTDELEKLACLVETDRFEHERTEYLEELHRKQVQKRKKKRGFLSWLFGWDNSDHKLTKEQQVVEEDERHRAAQELARSTLLHALQTERSNVDELESALMTLQRNNSVIMDVVQSRDELITELNDRVAVFEEDKMVLKAALRQLQLEIKEEAPKTQQLADELNAVTLREQRLREEIEELMLSHEDDQLEWERRVSELTKEQNKTEEQLELIGLYVDQLEDRLANRLASQKELEARERECEILEAESRKSVKEAEDYKCQVGVLTKEQGETKPLLEDLVKERSDARVKMNSLREQAEDLNQQIVIWKQRLDDADRCNEEIKSQSARNLFLRIEEEKTAWERTLAQRIEDEKNVLASEKDQELQQLLAHEKTNWETKIESANKEFLARLTQEKTELERNLMEDLTVKLEQQQIELEKHHQKHLQQSIDDERTLWEERKENEINDLLLMERSMWEEQRKESDRDSIVNVTTSVLLEDEVERAAAKVYARLEESGVKFGVMDPSLDPVSSLLGSGIENEDGCDDRSETDDMSEDASDTKAMVSQSEGSDGSDEDAVFETGDLKTRPQLPPKREIKPTRSVPFRTVRKAFSSATGLHGLITPSTVQLHQRYMHRNRRQQPRTSSTGGQDASKTDRDRRNAINVAESKDSFQQDGEDDSGKVPEALPSSSGPKYNEGDSHHDISSTETIGHHRHDNADSFLESSSSWSSEPQAAEGLFETPPLPDIDGH